MRHPPSTPPIRLTLADLPLGQSGVVEALALQGLERRRMMDLGLTPGARVTAEFRSPLGDPVSYRVRGALIALRRGQAQQIELDIADNTESDTN